MKEGNIIILLTVLFILAGLSVFYFSLFHTDFNFYESDVKINGTSITEILSFKPDKPYHTLYRNFQSSLYTSNPSASSNFIIARDIECSTGLAYVRNSFGACTTFNSSGSTQCPSYTENNEYGCTFGDVYGFNKNWEYWIKAEYNLHPENLFNINGINYIKFVIYSPNNHVYLKNNFIVESNIVRKKSYLPDENVIIYIPYSGDLQGINIIKKDSFEFDNTTWSNFGFLIFTLVPAIIILFGWLIFGKEKTYEDIPPELSFYPNERKAWEVAAFFNPPFNVINQNFFASMLLDFYHQKIIDIKMEGKDVWIKINKQKDKVLDNVQEMFLSIIQGFYKEDSPENKKLKYLDGEWLNLKEALKYFGSKSFSQLAFMNLNKEVKKESKVYLNTIGPSVLVLISVISLYFAVQINGAILLYLFLLYFSFIIVIIILNVTSALLVKFKESYYIEYQKWQAFKKYLSYSFSIRSSQYKGVIVWDNYLVYGTALGVSKKVIEELKKENIIDNNNYIIYMGVYNSSRSFSTYSGASRGHGGFGGAGGGGIGGGGGGGR
jgi:uncharacterized membrane protein